MRYFRGSFGARNGILRMGEIHWRNDIYLEKHILLFKDESEEKFLKSSENMIAQIFLTIA